MSLIEDDASLAPRLLSTLHPYTGRAHIVGVTGSAGTGKSTLVDQLAREYRKQGRTIGIIFQFFQLLSRHFRYQRHRD